MDCNGQKFCSRLQNMLAQIFLLSPKQIFVIVGLKRCHFFLFLVLHSRLAMLFMTCIGVLRCIHCFCIKVWSKTSQFQSRFYCLALHVQSLYLLQFLDSNLIQNQEGDLNLC